MKPSAESTVRSIAACIILSLVTFGIYGLFWQARLFRVVNSFLGQERFRFWPWFFLSLITFGIYNLYTQYQLGMALSQVLVQEKQQPNPQLNWLGLMLTVIGLHIVAAAIEQHEINQLYA